MTIRTTVSITTALLDTNLFDVIASLGTGLYVHHIELTSFPLCRLNRNLPAMVPGREGGEWCEVWCWGKHKQNKKIKMTWREQSRKGDTEVKEKERNMIKTLEIKKYMIIVTKITQKKGWGM